ncbi:DUF4913 domain-containing protein [Arthrobacter crystallopoietes]|uniref:DUF4913 domain-containing protein n=1 Tax=Crystallibacter crystallopoietes TaxID=37928 RepID=A0A1H0XL77_9MICC|nr:DUF4913 domain-containing protein [Arthrobacter crystallopoietes]SDQ03559.1 protein of unknown function [Arthrobacter crystallopoietes]
MTAEPQTDGEEPTEEELTQQFVMWVELMIHDAESVPDTNNERYWCPQWWAHPEAVSRLSALHSAYAQAVTDDTLSAWWVQHWDSHTRVLFSQHGPFENCQTRHTFHDRADSYTPRLLTEAPPTGWTP